MEDLIYGVATATVEPLFNIFVVVMILNILRTFLFKG